MLMEAVPSSRRQFERWLFDVMGVSRRKSLEAAMRFFPPGENHDQIVFEEALRLFREAQERDAG